MTKNTAFVYEHTVTQKADVDNVGNMNRYKCVPQLQFVSNTEVLYGSVFVIPNHD
jgi:hypothetical protein